MHMLAETPAAATLEFLQNGGVFIYPLILCSLAGLTAIGFKFMALGRSRTVPDGLVREMDGISEGDSEKGSRSPPAGR